MSDWKHIRIESQRNAWNFIGTAAQAQGVLDDFIEDTGFELRYTHTRDGQVRHQAFRCDNLVTVHVADHIPSAFDKPGERPLGDVLND